MQNLARELELERMRRTIDGADLKETKELAHLLLRAWNAQADAVSQMIAQGWLPSESQTPRPF